MQGWFDRYQAVIGVHHRNKVKNTMFTVILIDAEEPVDEVQYTSMIKNPEETRNNKSTYNKLIMFY